MLQAHTEQNRWCDGGRGYREITSARCDGCGSHLRFPSVGGCNAPSASCLPPFESVGHVLVHFKQDVGSRVCFTPKTNDDSQTAAILRFLTKNRIKTDVECFVDNQKQESCFRPWWCCICWRRHRHCLHLCALWWCSASVWYMNNKNVTRHFITIYKVFFSLNKSCIKRLCNF